MRKLLFFYADWCTPCKHFDKEFIAPIEKLVRKGKIERINAGEKPIVADKYNVTRLPTALLVDGDKVKHNYIWKMEQEEILKFLGVKNGKRKTKKKQPND